MKKLILFISLIISITASAQTYNGNITLLTQQDVDDFAIDYPGITAVNGILTIGPNTGNCNITNVDSLQILTNISVRLSIQNTQINSISNFNNLIYANSIDIRNNSLLQSITGFNGLTLSSGLGFYNNILLNSVMGFNNLNSSASINIDNCPILYISFPSLQNLNSFYLSNNNNIVNFTGFPLLNNLKKITIANSTSSFDFNLNRVYSSITLIQLINCNSINNLQGLNFNQNMTQIVFQDCSNLTDVSNLNNITSVSDYFTMHNIPSQLSINTFSNVSTAGHVNLGYLPSMFNFNSLTTTKNLKIYNLQIANVNTFNSLVNINGDLSVQFNNNLTNLSCFNHPINITGSVTINSNPLLTNCAAQAICNYLGVNSANATITGNATGCNSISEVTYACNPVPLTKIRTQDCGLQTTTFNQLFYADVVSYATNYEFEFKDISTGVITYTVRPNAAESLGDAGLLAINKTYDVRVRAKVGGVWGNFGAICQIKSPITVPDTKIRTQDCGLQTTTFNQLFYADAVSYASNYEFEFVDINTNVTTYKVRLNTAASLGDAGLLDINKTYNVRVRAKVGNNWGAFGTICQIKSPITVPETKIRTQDCGLQITTFNQLFYADIVSYASSYEFEYTDLNTNAITYKVRLNTAASLGDAGLLDINKTYNVRVRAKVGNNWGAFGTICQIKSPITVPETKIRTQDCGLQTTTFTQLYYADAVSYATNYEFEYTDINTGAITYRLRINNAASLNDAGLNQYNKIYNVRVRAKVGNNWSAFGTVCQIKSPINITQVNSVHCNLAYSIPDLFYCDAVANANAYEFEFTNTTTNVITSNIVTTTANSFATAGLPYYSKTYSVRVRAKIGTTWGSFGAPCILKSICSTCLRLASNDASTIDDSKNTSTIVIYPNPTTDVLNITELTEPSIINVFNVSGQLVLTKSSAESNEKIDLSSLDNGIYMIVIEGKNGEIAKRQRVVLAK